MSNASHRSTADEPGYANQPSFRPVHSRASSRLQLPDAATEPETFAGVASPLKRKNAFEELMAPKKKPKPAIDDRDKARPKTTVAPTGNTYFGRDGLLAYIKEPESFSSRVIYYDDDWVLIHDMYPKASVHLLLLSRDPEIYSLNPLNAFDDERFLVAAQAEVAKAKEIAASELRRIHGSHSKSERKRIDAMESEDPPEALPVGRDWEREIKTGVHANPSMNHLHIHILSRDMHSEALKKRVHYNSFNTLFFCDVDDMPMPPSEQERRRKNAGEELAKSMECWRCGERYGNKFAKLKEHLEHEFRRWREE